MKQLTTTAADGTTTISDDAGSGVTVDVEPRDRFGCRTITVRQDGFVIGDRMAMNADKAIGYAERHQDVLATRAIQRAAR